MRSASRGCARSPARRATPRRSEVTATTSTRSSWPRSSARRLLEAGQTFASVAQKYASDWRRIVGPGRRVGLIPDLAKDPQADPGGYDGGAPLRQAVFAPNSNPFVTLIGPVKSGRGWY